MLELIVLGVATGVALYVGWSAWQQWKAERAQRAPVIDAESTVVEPAAPPWAPPAAVPEPPATDLPQAEAS